DSYSLEIFTLLDLPAGTVTMGVNSDDGFRVTALTIPDARNRLGINLGQFDGGRGAAPTVFKFDVAQAGIYPLRMIYFEGGGDAEVEWFTVSTDGTKHLINDASDNESIKAYRTSNVPARAYARKVSPNPGDSAALPNATIVVE